MDNGRTYSTRPPIASSVTADDTAADRTPRTWSAKTLLQLALARLCRSRPGRAAISAFITATQYRVFSPRTVHAMRFDLLRAGARTGESRSLSVPLQDRLHLGCGRRLVAGWLNTDVADSEWNVDLSAGRLPWADRSFTAVVSQQVIEHLDLFEEGIPLLRELHRVMRPGGEIWLSCPDLEKFCRGYVQDRARSLLDDRKRTATKDLNMRDAPTQHFINLIFSQFGEHKNLFDFEMMRWALEKCGFLECRRASELELRRRFPEFPAHTDDFHALYVCAVKP